jgi:hypothetical protein
MRLGGFGLMQITMEMTRNIQARAVPIDRLILNTAGVPLQI